MTEKQLSKWVNTYKRFEEFKRSRRNELTAFTVLSEGFRMAMSSPRPSTKDKRFADGMLAAAEQALDHIRTMDPSFMIIAKKIPLAGIAAIETGAKQWAEGMHNDWRYGILAMIETEFLRDIVKAYIKEHVKPEKKKPAKKKAAKKGKKK